MIGKETAEDGGKLGVFCFSVNSILRCIKSLIGVIQGILCRFLFFETEFTEAKKKNLKQRLHILKKQSHLLRLIYNSFLLNYLMKLFS